MFFARPPFTPAMKRQQMLVYRVWLIFGWGIFPVTLIAVYAGAFHLIGSDPRVARDGLPTGSLLLLAALFVALMGLFLLIGRFARAQIGAMKAGRAPCPWPRDAGAADGRSAAL